MPRSTGFNASPSGWSHEAMSQRGVLFAAVQRRNLPLTIQLWVAPFSAENGETGIRTAMTF